MVQRGGGLLAPLIAESLSDLGRTRRREFLVTAAGGLLISLSPFRTNDAVAGPPLVLPFLSIAADGTVTVFAKHLDMGQGIWSGLASIIAEELDADWAHVRVVGAPAAMPTYAHTMYGAQTTGGSTSIANSWDQLRKAGAVARAMLVQAAADAWGVPAGSIRIEQSVVRAGNRSAGLGTFAAAAARLSVPDAKPKSPSDYRLLGRPAIALDTSDKTRGLLRYGSDSQYPGMKFAAIARPPRFGSRLAGYDATAARALPGVLEVVDLPSGVAVVAESTWQAFQARAALVTHWDESDAETRSSAEIFAQYERLRTDVAPTATRQRGSVELTNRGEHVVEAHFDFPMLAHAQMEPLAIAGRLVGGRCELRAGFQSQTLNQAAVAKILGLRTEDVLLETVPAGGSFGRRASSDSDWVVEIAHLLKATGGRWPLKLVRPREDDMAAGHGRPITSHHLRAALGDGRLLWVEQDIVGESPFAGMNGATPDFLMTTAVLGNFTELYDCANARLRWWRPNNRIPFETYRGVSNNHTCVSKEIFVDRLARAAGRDPIEFRLDLLAHDPRQQRVLRRAAAAIGWDNAPAAGRTRGVAVHASDGTCVAQIAELSETPAAFRIERVVVAVDLGRALNPDIIRSQVEGGIGFGLSSNLYSALTLADGSIEQRNFDRYRVLRMSEMPRAIEVHIVESDARPTGIGEPGSLPIAAAVVNALERMGHPLVARFPVFDPDA